MHAAALSRLDVDSDFIRVWGSAYRRVGRYEADYYGMAGPLRVERSIYRKIGERNGPRKRSNSLLPAQVARVSDRSSSVCTSHRRGN